MKTSIRSSENLSWDAAAVLHLLQLKESLLLVIKNLKFSSIPNINEGTHIVFVSFMNAWSDAWTTEGAAIVATGDTLMNNH